MTTIGDLIASGERISRPCFLLRSQGAGLPDAFWGGERADLPNSPATEMIEVGARRHILTIDPNLLKRLDLLFREGPVSPFCRSASRWNGAVRSCYVGPLTFL